MLNLSPKPLAEPGWFSRLLGLKHKANAAVLIWNGMAEGPLDRLPADFAYRILDEYGVSGRSAETVLAGVYAEILAHCVEDNVVSDEEHAALNRVRVLFGLSEGDLVRIEREILAPKYERVLLHAIEDGSLSPEEGERLQALVASLRLPKAMVDGIRQEALSPLLQRLFDRSIEDRRLGQDEEEEMRALAASLEIKITHDDATERKLDRFRLLWRIEQGELPVEAPSIYLQKTEICHFSVPATHHELRTVTRAVSYSGPTARVRIMRGVYWRVGHIAAHRHTEDVLKQLGVGELYLTNKRLIFDGTTKTTNIRLNRVIDFTVLSDGVQIQKDSGKDQFFECDGAKAEILGVILGSLLSRGD